MSSYILDCELHLMAKFLYFHCHFFSIFRKNLLGCKSWILTSLWWVCSISEWKEILSQNLPSLWSCSVALFDRGWSVTLVMLDLSWIYRLSVAVWANLSAKPAENCCPQYLCYIARCSSSVTWMCLEAQTSHAYTDENYFICFFKNKRIIFSNASCIIG